VAPDAELTEALARSLGEAASKVAVASFDLLPADAAGLPDEAGAADLQTVAVLARARVLGVAGAAILVAEGGPGDELGDSARDEASKRAGRAAATVL
jgi:hypothetical protein